MTLFCVKPVLVTVKTRLVLPSVTDTSAIASVGGGSSSLIVPVADPSPTVAFTGAERFTWNVSFSSSIVSVLIGTEICFAVSPGAKLSGPPVAV